MPDVNISLNIQFNINNRQEKTQNALNKLLLSSATFNGFLQEVDQHNIQFPNNSVNNLVLADHIDPEHKKAIAIREINNDSNAFSYRIGDTAFLVVDFDKISFIRTGAYWDFGKERVPSDEYLTKFGLTADSWLDHLGITWEEALDPTGSPAYGAAIAQWQNEHPPFRPDFLEELIAHEFFHILNLKDLELPGFPNLGNPVSDPEELSVVLSVNGVREDLGIEIRHKDPNDDRRRVIGEDVITLKFDKEEINKFLANEGLDIEVAFDGIPVFGDKCFAEGTPVLMGAGHYQPIESINVGDLVMGFDCNGDLKPCKVTQTHTGYTEEFIELDNGVFVTPGHRFLMPNSEFELIEKILKTDGMVVSEDGTATKIGGRFVSVHTDIENIGIEGNLARTIQSEGWKTYNLTVQGLHTYIAGGLRVHNDSLLAFFEGGTVVQSNQLLPDGTRFAIGVKPDGTLVTLIGRDKDGDGNTDLIAKHVGFKSNGATVSKIWPEFDENGNSVGDPIINVEFNDVLISGEQIGSIFGSTLGRQIAGGNTFAGIAAESFLGTVAANIGEALNIHGFDVSLESASGDPASLEEAFDAAFDDFPADLKIALTSNTIGSISSFLIGELVEALGIDGTIGEFLNSTGQFTFSTILNNVVNDAPDPFAGLDGLNFANVTASFLGNKLADQILSFDTIGGQIGGAIGGSIGSIVGPGLATSFAAATGIGVTTTLTVGSTVAFQGITVLTTSISSFVPVIGIFVGALLGKLLGGLIGSVFGGTPRSGADVVWDEDSQSFVVDNVWSKKGGSKEAAANLAGSAADTYNGVIAAIGGELMNGEDVQGGTFGLRKSKFTFRPDGMESPRTIFETADELINHGVFAGFDDLKIAGGDTFVKRAFYNSLSGATQAGDLTSLLGNFSMAQDYSFYLQNSASINALMAAEPDSAFTAGWVITLARAVELGLLKRHEADWYGGFEQFLKSEDASAANVAFTTFNGERVMVLTDRSGQQRVIRDTIDSSGKDTITGTAGGDVITVNGDVLQGGATGWTLNGEVPQQLKLTQSALTPVEMAAEQGITTAIGTAYTLAFEITGSTGAASQKVEVLNDLGVAIFTSALIGPGAHAFAFTATGAATSIRLLDTNGANGVSTWDDVSVKADGSNVELVRNGDFGEGLLGWVLDVNGGDGAVTTEETALANYSIDIAASIHGGDGNDTITGGDLGNELYGDAGNDTLTGGKAADWLYGGDGNDSLQAQGDGDYLDGGAGDDILNGDQGSQWFEGGAGADIIQAGAGGDVLSGGTDRLDGTVRFDGVDDYVRVANSGSSTHLFGSFTIESWVVWNGDNPNAMILNKEASYEIGIWADGSVKYALMESAGSWAWIDTGLDVVAGVKSHIALTYDNVTKAVEVYVDGLASTATLPVGPTILNATTDDLIIGNRTSKLTVPSSEQFEGDIYGIRIWNAALSQADIGAETVETTHPNAAALLMDIDFDAADLTVGAFTDNTGTFTATMVNGAAQVTDVTGDILHGGEGNDTYIFRAGDGAEFSGVIGDETLALYFPRGRWRGSVHRQGL